MIPWCINKNCHYKAYLFQLSDVHQFYTITMAKFVIENWFQLCAVTKQLLEYNVSVQCKLFQKNSSISCLFFIIIRWKVTTVFYWLYLVGGTKKMSLLRLMLLKVDLLLICKPSKLLASSMFPTPALTRFVCLLLNLSMKSLID